MNLLEVIKNKMPIDIYLEGDKTKYDTFYYNEKDNIYQGQFGFLDMDAITKVVTGKITHIKIREHNGNN